MRISDWSSDVCSSDLHRRLDAVAVHRRDRVLGRPFRRLPRDDQRADPGVADDADIVGRQDMVVDVDQDRKSVVLGKSVSVRVELGGRSSIQTKIHSLTSSLQHTLTYTKNIQNL